MFVMNGDHHDEIRPSWCKYDPKIDSPVKLSDSHSIPAPLAKSLRAYQIDGIRFLYSLYVDSNIGGGLLADEMGLGKTIQAIGLLTALSKKTNVGVIDANNKKIRGHYLIVSPASILYNWESELSTWSYFSVGVYYGPNRRQEIIYKNPERFEVLLTTYDILREDIDVLSSLLPWSTIILDEIHRLKDPKSRNHSILKSHLSYIPLKIGLAGIILQNKYQEMWALLDWVNPGCLGKWKYFNEKYSKPIELGLRQNATSSQLARARLLQEDLDSLKNKWILRRTKKDKFLNLPSKVDKIVYCAPTAFQVALFRKLLSSQEMQELWRKKDKRHSKRGNAEDSKKTKVFTFIHLFLKVANHVGLLAPALNKSSKLQNQLGSNAIAKVISHFYKDFSRDDSFLQLTDTKYSGKMIVLADLLCALKKENGGNKCLLFSYSTKVLDILEQFIQTRAYDYRRIDGETPAKSRFAIVNEFNDSPGIYILLLSTKAGGLGLNITGANVVIIYDPNWNPSHDLQAQDRAYRIGQTKDVRVFRLITSGCIEENIYLRQLYKQQLFSNAVDGEKVRRYFQGSPNFDKREVFGVKNLFSVKTGGISQTEAIFKRNQEMEKNFKSKKYHIENFELDPKKLFEGEDPFMIDVSEEDSDEKIISNYRKKKPKAPVDSVLSSKNILHVHENVSVIGGSRVEEEVSENAIRENEKEALPSKDNSAKEHKSIIIPPLRHLKAYKDRIFCTDKGTVFYGQTPNVMKKRDFISMATYRGLSERDFALKVVEMSPMELAEFLQSFYMLTKNINQAQLVYQTVREEIEEEQRALLTPKSKKDSLYNELISPNKRKMTPAGKGKAKKRLLLGSTKSLNDDVLFPSDNLFDDLDSIEPTKVKNVPLPSKSKSLKDSSEGHFFDSEIEETQTLETVVKDPETHESLEETQFDRSLLMKDTKSKEAGDVHSTMESPEYSPLHQKSPKPPPEGIYYPSKYPKSVSIDSDKFYESVFKSPKSTKQEYKEPIELKSASSKSLLFDKSVFKSPKTQKPEYSQSIGLQSPRSKSPLFDEDDSSFFDVIFSPSSSAKK